MSRLNALMCALVVAWSLSSHAADRPRLVVVPFAAGEGATESSASKFTSLVVEELKTRGDVVELAAPPATRAPAPAERPAAAKRGPSAEALGALDAGRKAFEDLRFEDAVGSLKKGIAGMLADPATADYEAVTDAWVKLAAAAFRMGDEKEAKTGLTDLARFAPEYALPPGYPPVFLREFEKAKKRVAKLPKASVSIEGPAGATAFLDGRDLGMVPVLEENVPAGVHYVKVEGPKGERFGQAVETSGAAVKVLASFGGGEGRTPVVSRGAVADPAVAATIDEGTQGRLSAYAKAANAEYALVGYVYKTSDSQLTAGAALFSAKKGAFAALAPVSFDPEVLTANTESFKLGDELTKRLTQFGASASLPLNLASRAARAGTSVAARTDTATGSPDEVVVAAPRPTKVVLVPREPPPPVDPVVTGPEVTTGGGEPMAPAVRPALKPWIVIAVAAGAAVLAAGVTTGIMAATSTGPFKPVTGTVTATW